MDYHMTLLEEDFANGLPESWLCVDCRVNTGPGMLTTTDIKILMAAAGGKWPKQNPIMTINDQSEIYNVRKPVWRKAGMEPFGGCICIGCLEKRLGRELKPKDFQRDHPFNLPNIPGTPRLLKRRKAHTR